MSNTDQVASPNLLNLITLWLEDYKSFGMVAMPSGNSELLGWIDCTKCPGSPLYVVFIYSDQVLVNYGDVGQAYLKAADPDFFSRLLSVLRLHRDYKHSPTPSYYPHNYEA